jgi:hypothetical protein
LPNLDGWHKVTKPLIINFLRPNWSTALMTSTIKGWTFGINEQGITGNQRAVYPTMDKV